MKRSTKRNDILLIALMLVIGGVLALYLYLTRSDGRQVVLRLDGEITGMYSISQNLDFPIENGRGGVNHLHIENGVVWLTEANCPDKICVQQGKIQYAGEAIICLPNGVVVEIDGEDELALDGVVN